MITKLKLIANYLTTKRESKKHGGYNIYQDDKIRISYDTYFPNVGVHVFIDGVAHLAVSHSGHGHTNKYHGGAWEQYVTGVLYPKAVKAEADWKAKREQRKANQERKERAPLNDWAVFS